MSILARPYFRIANRVADSPLELLDSYEVTAELHFTGSATSNINCGAIHNAAAKLWISFRFKLDQDFDNSEIAYQHPFGKVVNDDNRIIIFFEPADGTLKFYHKSGGAVKFSIAAQDGGADITSWEAGRWYHVLASISDVNAARFIVDNGTVVTDADVTAAPNGGDFVIGDTDDPGGGVGFKGIIADFVCGTDDLSAPEEVDLYNGIVPIDATEYYPLNEGTGVVALDYGSGTTNGTIDTACSWEGTGAQSSITLSPIPVGYDMLILYWENLIVNHADIQNLQLTMLGGAGDYDYSNQAFGVVSDGGNNGVNFILLGTCGDVPGVGRKSNGMVTIFNRTAQEKVVIGTEVGRAIAQTTIMDVFGFHIEAKDRTVAAAGALMSSLTITPAAGSLMGGSSARVLGINTLEGG